MFLWFGLGAGFDDTAENTPSQRAARESRRASAHRDSRPDTGPPQEFQGYYSIRYPCFSPTASRSSAMGLSSNGSRTGPQYRLDGRFLGQTGSPSKRRSRESAYWAGIHIARPKRVEQFPGDAQEENLYRDIHAPQHRHRKRGPGSHRAVERHSRVRNRWKDAVYTSP